MWIRLGRLVFALATCLVLGEGAWAQTQDEGVRERPDLVTRPELAVGYVLDVIRQGFQIGDVARMADFLPADYTDRQPDGSTLSREMVLALLRQVAQAARALPRPQGFEELAGLYDLQWTEISVEFQPASAAAMNGTVHPEAWSSITGQLPAPVFHFENTQGGWTVAASEGFGTMIRAILSKL